MRRALSILLLALGASAHAAGPIPAAFENVSPGRTSVVGIPAW